MKAVVISITVPDEYVGFVMLALSYLNENIYLKPTAIHEITELYDIAIAAVELSFMVVSLTPIHQKDVIELARQIEKHSGCAIMLSIDGVLF